MLKYEVNKNAALSQKSESHNYQFQQIDTSESKSLYYIGSNNKSLSGMERFDYDFQNFDNYQEAFETLENKLVSPNDLPMALICELTTNGNDDAFSFFQEIQNNHFLKSIPFIIVSNNVSVEEKKKSKKLGIDDFYTFPFEMNDLHNRISFLQQFKKEKRKIGISDETLFHNTTSLLKRGFDILASVGALIVLSPILLLVAILIRLESKGSVLYVSKRVGTGYHIFNLYKFRSMRQGADVELKNLAHLNQYEGKDDAGASFFKLDNDPRVTKFGKFLRNSSIDEIPQLLNVIKGDMSIVGNRPLPLYEAEQLTKDVWAKRFLAPAGLTGLWQVSRRGQEEMSVAERVILDNTYTDSHSFWLDLKIMLKTFPALISKISA